MSFVLQLVLISVYVDSIAKVKQSIKKDKKEVKEKERKEGELSKVYG